MSETSETSIANLVLRLLGSARTIDDINVENDPSALAIKSIYPGKRDAVLETFEWNFASDRIVLAEVAEKVPAFGYRFAFALPPGFLRIHEPDPEMVSGTLPDGTYVGGYSCVWPKDVKREGEFLLTNRAAPLYLKFGYRETNPAKFSPLFAELLAYEIAIICCPSMVSTGATAFLRNLYDAKQLVEDKARSSHAIQEPPHTQPEGSWARSRGGRPPPYWGR